MPSVQFDQIVFKAPNIYGFPVSYLDGGVEYLAAL